MTQTHDDVRQTPGPDVPNISAIPLEGVPSDDSIPYRPVSASRFVSREFADLEAATLWPRVWLFACREEEIPKPGDFVNFQILDQSLIVTRQADGSIKAFFNSCRHRGTELLCKASGSVKQFRCPNHAWTYALDGTLTNTLSPSEFPTAPNYALQEAAADTWGGFVFVNLDGKAEPLADFLGPVADVLARYRLGNLRVKSVKRWRLACNWKVCEEGFIEGYHLSGVHPQLVFINDDVNTLYETIGHHSRMQVPQYQASERLGDVDEDVIIESFRELIPNFSSVEAFDLPEGMSAADFAAGTIRKLIAERGLDLSELDHRDVYYTNSFSLFPNLLIQCYAGEALCWRILPDPDDHESCFFERVMLHYLDKDADPFTVRYSYVPNWEEADSPGEVLAQDFTLMPKIQRGLRQRTTTEVICASRQELRVSHLHDEMDRVMGLPNRQGL